jgi:ribosomal protein S18 acetylase RimI-like enzyme
MNFMKASAAPFDPRAQISEIFVHGFYDQGLKYLCKCKATLSRVLAHAFELEGFYIAVEGEKVASLVGISAKKPPPFAPCKATLRRELGYLRGSFVYFGLKNGLVNHPMPAKLQENEGIIEFVATHPDFRSRGAAGGLMEYVMANTPFSSYVLEVIDTNAPAIHLYKKLGFGEILRKKMAWPISRLAGFSYSIYMRKGQS